jgi:hypothetical protein
MVLGSLVAAQKTQKHGAVSTVTRKWNEDSLLKIPTQEGEGCAWEQLRIVIGREKKRETEEEEEGMRPRRRQTRDSRSLSWEGAGRWLQSLGGEGNWPTKASVFPSSWSWGCLAAPGHREYREGELQRHSCGNGKRRRLGTSGGVAEWHLRPS